MKETLSRIFRGDRVLIPIIFAALFARIWGLGSAPFFDEAWWVLLVKDMLNGAISNYTQVIPHPPLSVMLYLVFTTIGGFSIFVMRSMPLFIGLATVAVVFYFAKSLYGRKVAILSASLSSIIFYGIWMSLFIDVDGNVLTLFSLLAIYFFHKSDAGKDRKWLFLTGISLGLAMLSKYPAVLLIPVFFLHGLLTRKLKNARHITMAVLIGFAVFSIFPLAALLANSPETFTDTLKWGSGNIGRADSGNAINAYTLSVFRLVIFLFQYGTPLICLMPLYLLLRRMSDKKDCLLFSYVAVILLFFTFVIPGGPKARYIMPAIPALAILASKGISMTFEKIGRRDLFSLVSSSLAFFFIVLLLNAYGTQNAFNSQNPDLRILAENGMFWYSGFASTPFAIHAHSLIFIALFTTAVFAFSVIMPAWKRKSATLIISAGLAFNMFILMQSFFPTYGPGFTQTVSDMTSYCNEAGLDCTLYSTEKSFAFYLEASKYIDSSNFDGVEGCVLVVNVQDQMKNQDLKDLLSGCRKEKSFYSNGFEFGYIYRCG